MISLNKRWIGLLLLVGPPVIGLLAYGLYALIMFLHLGAAVGTLLALTFIGWFIIGIVLVVGFLISVFRDIYINR